MKTYVQVVAIDINEMIYKMIARAQYIYMERKSITFEQMQ